MLNLQNTPIPNPHILGRVVDDEAVLVLPDLGKVKVLNEVGAAIWQLVDGERTIQEISDNICVQFEAEKSRIETDTLQFIADLADRNIVTIE